MRHVYAVGRYTPSCWRTWTLCCCPSLTRAGVSYEYGNGSTKFIASGSEQSKTVMNKIQQRIDQVN